MNSLSLTVLNVKCGGCVSSIVDGLTPIAGVDTVNVDEKTGLVEVAGTGLDKSIISTKLSELGYPGSGL